VATNPPIQIGEITVTPAPGSGVSSAWCQQITARIVHRFATAAARTTAFSAPNPLPAKGTPSYLATNDATEGPEYWDGVAWRKPWNMPWGRQGGGVITLADQTIATTVETAMTNYAVTWTAVAGRMYRFAAVWNSFHSVGPGYEVYSYKIDGGAFNQFATGENLVANTSVMWSPFVEFSGLAAGVHTVQLYGRTPNTLKIQSTGQVPGKVYVDDVGPAPGVPTLLPADDEGGDA
jgi:hypothetical protein